jgi:RNA polymerase sigma-70 factor (ECF subfamily)
VETNHLSDQDLVERYLAGNVSAIDTLISRYKSKVYHYIYLVVRNQALAEDIFQDTFIKVIQSLTQGKYHDNGKFISWVMRIAHNLTIDYFRKEKQIHCISNDSCETNLFNSSKLSDSTIEDKIIAKQISKEVRHLVEHLPDEQREVILLRHYAGLSFKEIAEHTNVSINTALGRMRYAILNLRKLVEDNQICLSH